MKKIVFLIVASVTLIVAVGIGVMQSDKKVLSDLMLNNIEALADDPVVTVEDDTTDPQDPGGGGGWLRGYEATTRWILESITIGIPPGIQIHLVPIPCCKKNDNQMSGCDSSMAHSKC